MAVCGHELPVVSYDLNDCFRLTSLITTQITYRKAK